MPKVVLIGLLVLLGRPAWAGEACAPYVQEHPGWQSASFRVHTDAFKHCPVSEVSYREVLASWLRNRPAGEPLLKSLSLGRAVDFPWISEYLVRAALADRRWDAHRGRLRTGDLNGWVASTLSAPLMIQRLAAPFFGTGYAVTSVSVEKVLVGEAEGLVRGAAPPGLRVPFDAQLWLRLAPRPGPEAGSAVRTPDQ
jgi:hypothetical protein